MTKGSARPSTSATAPPDAVDFHTSVAQAFDGRYAHDERFKDRHAVWNELIQTYSGPGRFVLDVGCGSGPLSFLAASQNRRVVGIDGSEAMIGLALERCAREKVANARFIVGRLENLAPLVPEPCDLLLCSSVLEYLDDLEAALTVLTSTVRRGGIAILSMPNRQSLFRRIEPVLFHVTGRPANFPYVRNVLTLASLEQRLKARGCELLESRYYGSTPILSPACRALGRPQWSDTLFAAVFRRVDW